MHLSLAHIHASLGGTRVIRDVSLEARDSAFIGLIGPNGAGKTTLVRAIAALIPHEGTIELDGQVVAAMEPRARARAIAYLAQGAGSHWPLEVSRLVALGRLPHLAPFRAPAPEDEAAIARAMDLADVGNFRGRDVLTLSGGERARVLLARALAVEAPLLLVDEPVASLDPYHQLGIMEVLRTYASAGRTVIAVLHDLSLAARYCDRLVLLDEGVVKADGRPEDVLTPENLKAVYRIRAIIGGEGERFVMPLARTE
ncbi:ABC transporter ATP-binding protein [Parvibaculum sp.]|uniref:ABC transporter ATP-binding protein n=1 Tax=Parvibaculum sp. TaxID=2024848 RepID=UPI001D81A85E|nr:ABC transporter ATP-binding protein [Parvibaculum sp.]MBX3490282.1 ABC transporter ATP-binding protein [Parvibaculum sp.]MCW5728209.1 ABC transporter ATP-binding protein [Parvibaculum sp.]